MRIKADAILKMADLFCSAIKKLAEEKHSSAGMIFYCPNDKTVLLTQRGDSMSSPGAWDIQGGRWSEEDITSEDTANREAKEEIGALPKEKKLLGKHVLPRNSKGSEYVIYLYSISEEEKKTWTPKIKLDHESSQFKWVPYNELPKDTHFDMSWLKKALDELTE